MHILKMAQRQFNSSPIYQIRFPIVFNWYKYQINSVFLHTKLIREYDEIY